MAHDQATLDDLLSQTAWMQGLARRLLGDADAADDVVQETWLNALRVPPARGSTLRPWLATVMRNLVRSRRRRDARARVRESHFASSESSPAAEDLLAERQTERVLAELVLALDEPYRRTVLRRFHDGQSAAEIARAEGTPEGTVRWRLKHALDELRRNFADDGSDGRALAALLPLAGQPFPGHAAVGAPVAAPLPVGPDPVTPVFHWIANTAVGKGAAALTAAAAIAAVTVAVVDVRRRAPLHRARAIATAPLAATAVPAAIEPTAIASGPAMEATVPPSSRVDDPVLPPVTLARTILVSPTLPTSKAQQVSKIPTIAGIVRDSRGEAAAFVPVTLRTLNGSGAAERTTTTDDAGRFRFRLRPHNRFVLTAELSGEPAARVEIGVPSEFAVIQEVDANGINGATIEVALDSAPDRPISNSAKARQADAATSRWCCRQAFLNAPLVHGRGCLKFDDSQSSGQSGCELYGLKAQVSCHQFTQGGLSTGDLSRTEELACNGRLM